MTGDIATSATSCRICRAQPVAYGELMPTMRDWRRLAGEGKLNDVQKLFFAPYKPIEELYDVEADPHEVVNLADKPEQAERLKALRGELERWMTENRRHRLSARSDHRGTESPRR
ncbi:MAG: hypothetical protein QM811_09885 [Pirellulales bacterium]